MARPKLKTDIVEASKQKWEELNEVINSLTENELNTVFDFSSEKNKREAHWKRDRNLKDVLIHLYEWHQLLLKWIEQISSGNKVTFLPTPYNWKTYGQMNVEFVNKHSNTTLQEAKKLINESHKEIMELLESFSNDELEKPDVYLWGNVELGSYFVSTTSSHYEWAIKKLKAHKKNCKKNKNEE